MDVDALSLELLVDELLESLALATLELELDALDVSLDDELAEEGISSLELSSVDESLEGVDSASLDEIEELVSELDATILDELDTLPRLDELDALPRLDVREVLCSDCLDANTPEVTLVFTAKEGRSEVRRNVKVADASLEAIISSRLACKSAMRLFEALMAA